MKRIFVIFLGIFLFCTGVRGQVVERTISVSIPSNYFIYDFQFLDADSKEIVPDVKVVISSKKVKVEEITEDGHLTVTKSFKSAKVHFYAERDGYETLEQDIEIDSNSKYFTVKLNRKETGEKE